MGGPVDEFRGAARAAVGLPADPGEPPDLMRLGMYRARVDSAAADGSTLDVTPDDKRIAPEKGAPLRVGIPGAVAIVQPGAIVMLGWERGDSSKPYCEPSWESGATVLKLQINAQALELAGNAHPLPLFDTFFTDLATWIATVNTLLGTLVPVTGATGGPAYATAIALPTSLVVKMATPAVYESQVVKNG